MKNNLNNKKNLFKKSIITFFIMLFIFSNLVKVSAQNSQDIGGQAVQSQAVQSIEGLSDAKHGLMPCDPFSDNESEQCHPRDAIDLLKTLFKVALYICVIGLWAMALYYGIKYVYYGKNPQELAKLKKGLQYSATAIGILIVGYALLMGILTATNFDKGLLNFFKQIFAGQDFNFIHHAYAQDIPQPTTGANGEYTNFFAGETVGSLLLKIMQVFISYIAAPALVIATMYTGFLFVKAQGNPEGLKEAKDMAKRVVIGIIIAASISAVTTIILNTLNDVTKKVNETTTTFQSPINEAEYYI